MIVYGVTKIPSYGRQILCPNLGSYAFSIVFAQESFHIKNRPQTFRMACNGFRCLWLKMVLDKHVTRFQFQDFALIQI
jgi:hypothetical protein